MLFIDWRQFWLITLPVTVAVLCVFLIWQTRSRDRWLRMLTVLAALPIMLLGLGLTLLFVLPSLRGLNQYSTSIPSPNGNRVARIETWEGLLAGQGGTNVKVYSLHGLSSRWAFGGSEQDPDAVTARWLDDHTLEIRYNDVGNSDIHVCNSTHSVRVICLPADTSSP